jgi:hypothetical protein
VGPTGAGGGRRADRRPRAAYHPVVSGRGMRASLHASLAADHERLGQLEQAREQLGLAEAAVPALPDGGYGDLVRCVIMELRERLTGLTAQRRVTGG